MCGYPHPDIMINRTGLTSKQLEESIVYLSLFPIGERRMDNRFSILCSILSCANGGKEVKINLEAEPYELVFDVEKASDALFDNILRCFGYGR